MYKLIFLLSALCNFLVINRMEAQTITMTDPASTTYRDSVLVKWTINEPAGKPQQIYMDWTYSSGPGTAYIDSVWELTFSKSKATGSFYFYPATVLTSGDFTKVSRDNPMPDGTWKVSISYTRPLSAGGGIIRSAQRSGVVTSTHTLPPTLINPPSSRGQSSPFNVHYTLPSTPLANSVILKFQGPEKDKLTMSTSKNVNFNLKTHQVKASSAQILSATSDTLLDGLYTVSLSYQDAYGHPAAQVMDTSVLIQTVTPAPTVLYPLTGAMFTSPDPIKVQFYMPFPPKKGTEKITFIPGNYVYMPVYNNTLTDSLLIPDTDTKVRDGSNYSIIFSYSDSLNNPVASDTVTGITVHRQTVTPSLSSPAAYLKFNDSLLLKYKLNGTPAPGTVKLVFVDTTTGKPVDSVWINSSQATESVKISSFNLNEIGVASSDTLPEGVYDVYISCQDSLGNPAAASGKQIDVTCQRHTTPAHLASPVAGQTYTQIPIQYTLPETAKPGTVHLLFSGPYTISFTMNNGSVGSPAYINPFVNPAGHSPFTSGSSNSHGRFIPNGTYIVILSYQDNLGNQAGYDTVANMTVDSSTVLPVTLMDFNAGYSNHQAILTWQTATELNNAYFVVQKSTAGTLFDSVGIVLGAGNSTSLHHYSFLVPADKAGSNPVYFRLKLVAFDGESSFSRVVMLAKDQPGSIPAAILSPNPSHGQIRLTLNKQTTYPVWMTVYDQGSRLMYQKQVWGLTTDINLSAMPKGIYLIRLYYQDGGTVTRQIVLQ
jgi:hypothetical protein